jgi:hypothetical protein
VLACKKECLTRGPLELRQRQFPSPLWLVGNAILARAERGTAPHPQVDRVVVWSWDQPAA